MADPWNLKPEEWSDILVKSSAPEAVADKLRKGNYLPWSENLLEYTEETDEILDLGSGAGENSAILALRGRKTTLMDWAQDNLIFDKRLFGTIGVEGRFCRADMTRPLPFKGGSFDTVFSCGVFEYFTDEEIKGILKEALRISRKRVIIMVPNAMSVPYRIGYWYMKKNKQWKWGGERPLRTLKPYFEAAGTTRLVEFSVGVRHSLNFLTMPKGELIRKLIVRILDLKDHSKPAWFAQGYLLIAVAEKNGRESGPGPRID